MASPALPLLALALTVGDRPLPELPYTPGLDTAAMDRTVDPCVDLYRFSCGGWKKANPIPPDQASWSVYAKTATENLQFLWGLLEAAAAKPDAERTPNERLVGDAFAACMDEKTVEARGLEPLKADLAAIDALTSKAELAPLVARLHLSVPHAMLFDFSADQSFENSDEVVPWISAGGLGLPDRDYYLLTDARSAGIRRDYRAYMEETLRLSGLSPKQATARAAAIFRLETALAKASLTVVEKRDPKKLWHKTLTPALLKKSPSFDWAAYLAATGAPATQWLNLAEPAFLSALDQQLAREPLDTWKAYLRWHLVRVASPYLSSPFQKAHFAFYSARLRGAKEERPRWKRCVGWADDDFGEALGQLFVAKVFPPSVKADTEAMVKRIQVAMDRRIDSLDWMAPETRKAAHEKLAAMRNKVGYPEKWRDYSSIVVRRDDFVGNSLRATAFEVRRRLAKIGKPVDRTEWEMSPPTVNAYYNASMNDMNFPAGVLLPPLWDPRLDLAPGYGNTGGTVGHELIHGFDDEGRQFDALGNLHDWWGEASAKQFEKRAQCIVDQYAHYTVVDEVKINSKLTLGEDLADLAGLLLAWDAWKAATQDQKLEPRDGLTPEQRFFVGFAQWDCANDRPEDLRLKALTNPHSPAEWRINGVVVNVPEFASAFSCKQGQPMVRRDACRIW